MKLTTRAVAICILALLTSFSISRMAVGQNETRTHVRVVTAEEQALHDLLVKAKNETDSKDYSEAQEDYEKYLSQRPNDASAHFDLGYVYTAQQQNEKAIAEYRQAIALDPKMEQAQLNLGITLLSNNPKDAIEPLQNVVALDYSFARGHLLLGVAEQRSGDTAAAEKELLVAAKLNPDDPEAHAQLGRVYLADGRATDAEAQFQEMLRLKPGDSEGEMGLVDSLLRQKKDAEAVSALGVYLNANPKDEKARVMLASALAQIGKDDDALAALDAAAKDGPETVEALKLRSTIYYKKNEFSQAVAALQKAEAMAPQDAEIHASLGHALLETKDYGNAVRELSAALRLSPSSTPTLRDLISAEYLQKNSAATLDALDALAKREPPNAGAWFVRASCYDRMNQPEKALEAYQKFLAMNTDQNSNQYFEATQRVRFLKLLLKQKGR